MGAGGTVTCTNPSLSFTSGDVFTLVVNVPTDAAPGTFFTNTATVSTTTFDPNDENNSSTTSTLVIGNSADIAVTKMASPDPVTAGSSLTYTIKVSNSGPDSADNVTLNDSLPATVTFVSLSQPAGWTCVTPAVGAGGAVSCSRPSLAVTSGDIFTLVVAVRSDTPADTVVSNTATVSTSTPEASNENNSDTASAMVAAANPTAANGAVGGQIVDGNGNPVEGAAVRLSGTQNRLTVTDAAGNYHFDNVETNGFYTVMPSRVNYNFAPSVRGFSALGAHTEASFAGAFNGNHQNPLDTTEYFVRQQYVDFLGREPEEKGFNDWTDTINNCAPGDASCDRVHVSEAFFRSEEFQQRGYFVYRFYSTAFGQKPDYASFAPDLGRVSGFLDATQLEAAKTQFANDFTNRAAFVNQYGTMNNAQYVDALAQTAGVTLSNRQALVNSLEAGTLTRAQALRQIAESGEVYQRVLQPGVCGDGVLRLSQSRSGCFVLELDQSAGCESANVEGCAIAKKKKERSISRGKSVDDCFVLPLYLCPQLLIQLNIDRFEQPALRLR